MSNTIPLDQESHNSLPPPLLLRPLPPPNKLATKPPLRNIRRSKILPHECNSRHPRKHPPPSPPLSNRTNTIPPKKPESQIHIQIAFPPNTKFPSPPYHRLHLRIHIPLLVLPEILLPKNILRSDGPTAAASTSTPKQQHIELHWQKQQSFQSEFRYRCQRVMKAIRGIYTGLYYTRTFTHKQNTKYKSVFQYTYVRTCTVCTRHCIHVSCTVLHCSMHEHSNTSKH